MRFVAAVLAATLCAAAPAAAEKVSKAEKAALALSPTQIAAMVVVKDDPLDTKLRLDSSAVFQQKDGLLKIVNGDRYLRAFIDRKSGATLIQIYMYQRHGSGWQHWNRAVAESPTGPVDLTGHRVDGDVSCTRYGCTYTETVAIDVSEEILRWAATGAQAGVDQLWTFKVYGKYADGFRAGLMKTEIAGFLMKLDEVRARL